MHTSRLIYLSQSYNHIDYDDEVYDQICAMIDDRVKNLLLRVFLLYRLDR